MRLKEVCLFFSLFTAIFIFYVSSIRFDYDVVPRISFEAVLYHYSVFFILTCFLLLSLRQNKTSASFALVLSFLYACFDEIHQFYVPGRSLDLFDLLIDFSGSLSALIFIILLKKNNKFRLNLHGQLY